MSPELPQWVGKIANSVTGLVQNDSDMAGVDGETAVAVMEEYARIERMAAIGKMKAAARVAETQVYRSCGDKDAATFVARRTGCSKRDAQRSLDAANALDELPATKAAAERGDLSEAQLREVADGATVNPDAERDLLAAARTQPLAGLKERAQRAKASATDEATAHERIRKSRHMKCGTDAEGAFWLAYRNTGDVGAAILAAVRPIQDRLFREARDRGERDSYEAYAADAMTELIVGTAEVSTDLDEADSIDTDETEVDTTDNLSPEHETPPRRWPPRPNRARPSRDIKVIVRVDHQALDRGHTVAGETCDIVGVGQVPVATVKEMMGDAFLAAIVTDGVDVRSVAHLGRKTTAHQQTALEFTQPDCDVLGCIRTMFLQTDHRTGWAKTKDTVYDDLDRLCEHHHELKTTKGWRLEPGTGKRRFPVPRRTGRRHPGPAPPTRPRRLTPTGRGILERWQTPPIWTRKTSFGSAGGRPVTPVSSRSWSIAGWGTGSRSSTGMATGRNSSSRPSRGTARSGDRRSRGVWGRGTWERTTSP